MSGDTATYYRVMATFNEIDAVGNVFEDFRTKINDICIQYPQHSVIPQVLSMVETMIGPAIEADHNLEQVFVESIKSTVESFMPWEKFLRFSNSE